MALQGRSVAVVVLGDVGRSPRMQYHALSCLEAGASVSLVGYRGEALVPPLRSHPRLHTQLFSPLEWPRLKKACWPLFAVVKAAGLVLQLLWALVVMPRPSVVMVQNPPALPLLPVAWLACVLRGAALVIDWHNLGFTLLAMALGQPAMTSTPSAPVRVYKAVERWCARRASGHLCVTEAMTAFLLNEFQITATVLHDCPPAFFRSISVDERHKLCQHLKDEFEPAVAGSSVPRAEVDDDSLFTTTTASGVAALRTNRPPLVVSSTSWTEDEDFGILLGALVRIDQTSGDDFPFTVVVVTGKGPQKAMYQQKIADLQLRKFCVLTMWLEAADYPRLLSCADLGVCLHTSSSGLDLPMKVVDMFGSGLPVCAVGFACIGELVHDKHNGLVFDSSEMLAEQITNLLTGFPNSKHLAKLRSGVQATVRWEENWQKHALPVLAQHQGSTSLLAVATLVALLSSGVWLVGMVAPGGR